MKYFKKLLDKGVNRFNRFTVVDYTLLKKKNNKLKLKHVQHHTHIIMSMIHQCYFINPFFISQ